MDPIPLETVKVIIQKDNRRATLPVKITLWITGGLLLLGILI